MTKKQGKLADDKTQKPDTKKSESWRKPLQVPPRENAMRSFYQGEAEEENPEIKKRAKTQIPRRKDSESAAEKNNKDTAPTAKREVPPETKSETENKTKTSQTINSAPDTPDERENSAKLTEAELSAHLGFEAGDLFDVRELLRGKSFDIYQNLRESSGDTGRCKITQPELMARTGIKNRRTFYKHEERLLNLKLLEKRHLPGDHQGVVYRVFEIGEVLPIPQEMLEKFENEIKLGGE